MQHTYLPKARVMRYLSSLFHVTVLLNPLPVHCRSLPSVSLLLTTRQYHVHIYLCLYVHFYLQIHNYISLLLSLSTTTSSPFVTFKIYTCPISALFLHKSLNLFLSVSYPGYWDRLPPRLSQFVWPHSRTWNSKYQLSKTGYFLPKICMHCLAMHYAF